MAEASAWAMIPKSRNKGTEVTLDMRPLVLCKDCKHYTGGLDGYCDKLFRKTGGEMWFCGDGERMEE